MVTVLTMSPTLGDVLKWEGNPSHSRRVVRLKSGVVYPLGSVLGKARGSGAVTVSPGVLDAGAAGNGTMSNPATPYTAAIKEGVYTVKFTSATKADVEDPEGKSIGTATVGALFDKEVKFTLVAGGTPFAAGDRWTIGVSIASNSGDAAMWNPAGTDGTEEVYGVLLWRVDATDGAVDSVAVVREAIVSKDALVFIDGATSAQKSDAYVMLEKLGIAVNETA